MLCIGPLHSFMYNKSMPMKKVGIWIDNKQAQIIRFKGLNPVVDEVISEVEDYHPKGGSRSKVAYGPMDKMDEHNYEARKEHQLSAYFNKIIEQIRDASLVYIFGPAQAKLGLEKALGKSSICHARIVGVDPADSMTENQKVAQVRSIFKID